jgi:dCMP deaminase
MRPSWDSYFLCLADLVATRSTCSRASVGCVLVRDNRIIACGYNGAPRGHRHCEHVPLGPGMIDSDLYRINDVLHCEIGVHAETNAVADCARRGVSCDGCIAYVSFKPCRNCELLMVSAGILKVRIP